MSEIYRYYTWIASGANTLPPWSSQLICLLNQLRQNILKIRLVECEAVENCEQRYFELEVRSAEAVFQSPRLTIARRSDAHCSNTAAWLSTSCNSPANSPASFTLLFMEWDSKGINSWTTAVYVLHNLLLHLPLTPLQNSSAKTLALEMALRSLAASVLATLGCYVFYQAARFFINLWTSPLRTLRGPPNPSLFFGNMGPIQKSVYYYTWQSFTFTWIPKILF